MITTINRAFRIFVLGLVAVCLTTSILSTTSFAQTDWSNFVPKDFTPKVEQALKKIDQRIAAGPYRADWDSLNTYQIPEWYQDAKFGIFIHWGVYCVPEYSYEWYPRNMYCDVDGPAGDTARFHKKNYGPLDRFGYKDLIAKLTADKFDANQWAELFKESGARYIVPVAEHHDGFAMYDCSFSQWTAAQMGPKKDIIGELASAVRKQGLYFGVSSHRAFNWNYFPRRQGFDSVDPKFAGLYGRMVPALLKPEAIDYHKTWTDPDDEFRNEWLARTGELVDKYQPDLLWFDFGIGYGRFKTAEENPWAPHLQKFASYYYNHAASGKRNVPVINYKWKAFPEKTAVLDLERSKLDKKRELFWQTDTSIAKNSWCYTAHQDYKSTNRLVDDLIDIVSKNGCLLLNIGPKKDGTIPAPEQKILRQIGAWLKVNGEAIYESRPFVVFGEGPTKTSTGHITEHKDKPFGDLDYRYTVNGDSVYAFVLEVPKDGVVKFKSLGKSAKHLNKEIKTVSVLGYEGKVDWQHSDDCLEVKLDTENPAKFATVVKLGF